jgi:hypothetical protein
VIFETAAAILDHYTGALAAAGSDPFDEAFVADGVVAFDGCSRLVVEHEAARVGTPGNPVVAARVHAGLPLAHGFRVWVLRCVPVPDDQGNPPTASDITASAAGLLAERDRIIAATYDLADALGPCTTVALVDVSGVGPEGGVGGTSVGIAVQ